MSDSLLLSTRVLNDRIKMLFAELLVNNLFLHS